MHNTPGQFSLFQSVKFLFSYGQLKGDQWSYCHRPDTLAMQIVSLGKTGELEATRENYVWWCNKDRCEQMSAIFLLLSFILCTLCNSVGYINLQKKEKNISTIQHSKKTSSSGLYFRHLSNDSSYWIVFPQNNWHKSYTNNIPNFYKTISKLVTKLVGKQARRL